jgi:hypothetical protein
VDAVLALQRENKEVLWGSMVKETMKRKKPSFNETYYGFRTFSHLLEEAQRKGIVTLRRDQKSGSYVVEDLGTGAGTGATTLAARGEAASAAAAERPPPRRRGDPSVPLAATGTDSAEPGVQRRADAAAAGAAGGRRPRGSSTGTAAGYPDDARGDGRDDGTDATTTTTTTTRTWRDDAAHAEASDAGREPGPAGRAERRRPRRRHGRGEPLRLPRPRRRYAGTAVLAVLVDSPPMPRRRLPSSRRRAVEGRPGGLSRRGPRPPCAAAVALLAGGPAPPRGGGGDLGARPAHAHLPDLEHARHAAATRHGAAGLPTEYEPGLTQAAARTARASCAGARAGRGCPRRTGARRGRGGLRTEPATRGRPKLRSTERSARRCARAASRSFFI